MNPKVFRIIIYFLIASITIIMDTSTLQAKELAPYLYKETFDNGLTLLVKEVPGVKVATVQIWVKAGSVYEAADEAGITHFIEHMIFKGTATRGPGEVAAAIEEVGGRINAYTSFEHTVYHATLSARHWQRALTVLVDAVLNSVFDSAEIEREKKVVLEELRMRKDRPTLALYQKLMSYAYTVHPYRLPIGGTEDIVVSFSRDDIMEYLANHYHPDNFTVVIVGDVEFLAVREKVYNLLAHLPDTGQTLPSLPPEPAQQQSRFFVKQADINQTHLMLALPVSAFDSPDAPVLDVINNILGHGETSRLYYQLRHRQQLVYQISSISFMPKDPGLLQVAATFDADKVEDVFTAILTEIFKLKYLPVSDHELRRAKLNLESDFIFNLERVEGQARVLGGFELMTNDPRKDKYLAAIREVSAADINEVAARYFKPTKITAGIVTDTATEIALDLSGFTELITKANEAARNAPPPSLITDSYLGNVHKFVLVNGIRLLVRENPAIPTVAIRAVFPGGLRSETSATNGAFAFISELLPKGTESMSARELAVQVADMAGEIDGFNGKNTFGLKADFLSQFFEDGLQLVRDIIRTPAFNLEEAEKIRPTLLARLKQQQDSLPSLTFRTFNQHLFLGHPYSLNTAGSASAIQNFTVADLQKLYGEHAHPSSLVLSVAGDVEAKQVKESVAKLFGDWQIEPELSPDTHQETFLPPDPPVTPEIINIPRDKKQTHIIIGFLGATLTSEDRFALEVMDMVLSGLSGRLFTELRDKKSLAYSLSSFSLLGLDTGSFGIYIGTSHEKKDKAVQEVWQQLYRIKETLVSDEELIKAKNILISQYEMGLQTHGAQAMEMALNATYGLGQDFGNRYTEKITEVTAEQVMAVARKYIQSEHYVKVIVGAEPEPEAEPSTYEREPESGQQDAEDQIQEMGKKES